MQGRCITLTVAAGVLGVSYGRAAELARLGVLPVVRLGRQVRVDAVRLEEFISNGGRALPGGWRQEAK